MSDRRQEKIGWILGWSGGFVWVLILSIVFFVQGKILQGCIGVLITSGACVAILFFAPWRYPHARYRLLMAPIYTLLLLAIAWGVWAFGDPQKMGINSWWSALILLPVLIPFWTVGERRWDSDDA